MHHISHGPAPRFALALGLVAGALLIPSASMSEVTPQTPAADAPAAAAPVERPVSFAADQADRGKDKFERECVECHGDDLKGGLNGGAPLRGLSFEQKFADGAPASSLYLFMTTLMPPNSPGRFSPASYADMMAYILKRNGFSEGAPLPSDVDALDSLIMVK